MQLHETIKEEKEGVSAKKDYVCEKCNQSFRDSSNMKAHVRRVHEKVKNLVCTYCGKFFFENHGLKVHVEKVHEFPNLREHSCDACGKAYKSKEHLKKHKIGKITYLALPSKIFENYRFWSNPVRESWRLEL